MDDSQILADVDAEIERLTAAFTPGVLPRYEDIVALRASRIVADYAMYCPQAPLSEELRAAVVERLAR